jgi:hypothetical protein
MLKKESTTKPFSNILPIYVSAAQPRFLKRERGSDGITTDRIKRVATRVDNHWEQMAMAAVLATVGSPA